MHLGTTIVVGYGGWLALHGELTPGQMTRFLGYMLIMFGPVRRFAELNITYQSSLSAIRRVFDVFRIAPTVVDPPFSVARVPPRGHVRLRERPLPLRGSDEGAPAIGDERRTRAGGPGRGWVLDGVSLEAQPGERIAVVGRSGAGKTTLRIALAAGSTTRSRVACSSTGSTCVDYSLRALRGAIAIVQQETFVFSGSIRDNLAYARPEATQEEILARGDGGSRARVHRPLARRLRHAPGRARGQPVRRPAPATVDRSRDPEGSAHSRPRRGDELARCRERVGRAAAPSRC